MSYASPLARTFRAAPYRPAARENDEQLGWTVNRFSVTFSTARFNNLAARCKGSRLARRFYDVGSWATVLCMILAFATLLYSNLQMLLYWTASPISSKSPRSTVTLRKRYLPEYERQSSLILRPILPGVNLPLSHLPLLLASLIISSGYHEYGHMGMLRPHHSRHGRI